MVVHDLAKQGTNESSAMALIYRQVSNIRRTLVDN